MDSLLKSLYETIKNVDDMVKVGELYEVIKNEESNSISYKYQLLGLCVSSYISPNRLDIRTTVIDIGETILVLEEIKHQIFLYSGESQIEGAKNWKILYNNKIYNMTNTGAKGNLKLIKT